MRKIQMLVLAAAAAWSFCAAGAGAVPPGRGPDFGGMRQQLDLTDEQVAALQGVFKQYRETCRGITDRTDFRVYMREQRDEKHAAFSQILTAEQLVGLQKQHPYVSGDCRFGGKRDRRVGRGRGYGKGNNRPDRAADSADQ